MRKHFSGRKTERVLLTVMLLLSMTLTACGTGDNKDSAQIQTAQAGSEAGASEGEAQAVQASEKDDYYEAINRELIDSWEIEPDESAKNWFGILQDRVDERMTEIIRKTSEEPALEKGSDESNIRAMYLTGMDKDARNEGGFGKTVSAFFDEVDAAGSVDELMRACSLTETMVYTQFSGSTSVPILRIPLQRSSASMRETAGLIRKSGFPTMNPTKKWLPPLKSCWKNSV